MKRGYRSKTLSLNISVLALTPLYPPLHEWVRTHGDQAMAAVCLMNIVLRFFTRDQISISLGRLKGFLLPMGLGALGISGCTPTPQELDPKAYYDRLIRMEIDGVSYRGSAVLLPRAKYQIRLKTPGDMDYLSIETCQRYEPYEPKRSDFTFTFTPKATEKAEPCPLEIKALERGKSRLSQGWILFPTEGYDLPATLDCNEEAPKAMTGISYCESRAHKKQTISFPVPVNLEVPLPQCADYLNLSGVKVPFFERIAPNLYTFRLPRGNCTAVAKEVGQERYHLIYTYGSDETLPERF